MAKAMQPQKLHFSQAMQTEKYKNLINNTLGDPVRAARFAANITSAVAVNPTLQECDAGTILAGALLGEKHGKVYSGRHCNPGEDYQCRCVAKPVFNFDRLNSVAFKEKKQ